MKLAAVRAFVSNPCTPAIEFPGAPEYPSPPDNMKLLTRAEEFVLVAVWRLQDDAYSVRISEELESITGESWSLGSVYMPLNRLRKQGLVRTFLSDATPERGGRPKRMYRLTESGVRALVELKAVEGRLWSGIRELKPGVA